jgi:hypothetical protein
VELDVSLEACEFQLKTDWEMSQGCLQQFHCNPAEGDRTAQEI